VQITWSCRSFCKSLKVACIMFLVSFNAIPRNGFFHDPALWLVIKHCEGFSPVSGDDTCWSESNYTWLPFGSGYHESRSKTPSSGAKHVISQTAFGGVTSEPYVMIW
jgi:hypothetical protein